MVADGVPLSRRGICEAAAKAKHFGAAMPSFKAEGICGGGGASVWLGLWGFGWVWGALVGGVGGVVLGGFGGFWMVLDALGGLWGLGLGGFGHVALFALYTASLAELLKPQVKARSQEQHVIWPTRSCTQCFAGSFQFSVDKRVC